MIHPGTSIQNTVSFSLEKPGGRKKEWLLHFKLFLSVDMYGSSVPGTEFWIFKEPGTGTDKFWNREPKIRFRKAHFRPILSTFSGSD